MTPLEYIRKAVRRLSPCLGAGEARAVAELLFHRYKGWTRTGILMHDDEELSETTLRLLDKAVDRIAAGEPVQYVTGEAYFYGLWFKVDPRVLIPRPETAELVDMIVDFAGGRADLDVLDLATGSGCIAIALARTLRFAQVSGLDISDAALRVARENARALGADVRFFEADMLSWRPEPDSLDIVAANPPYIDMSERDAMEPTVRDHEPSEALFVPDADPLRYYRPAARIAYDGLRRGGAVFLEINPRHADEITVLLNGEGFSGIEIRLDSYGRKRFAFARKSDPS